MNLNGKFTEELSKLKFQNEQSNNRSLNKFALNALPLLTCNMGYEDTGQYPHLLPQEQQDKYIKLAAIKEACSDFNNPYNVGTLWL
jgi:hypothetical protein